MALPQISPYEMPTAVELPRARGPWQLDGKRAALLVHDMQQYFLRPYPEAAEPLTSLLANIQRLLAACRAAGVPVFYTCQQGNQDPQERGLQKDLWGPGMSACDAHENVHPAIAPQAGEVVLHKHRYSAFQRSDFAEQLEGLGRDQLIVCGVYAHIGCLMTAGEAFQRDIVPFMAADALADFSRARHEMTLDHLANCLGVPLTTSSIEAILDDR